MNSVFSLLNNIFSQFEQWEKSLYVWDFLFSTSAFDGKTSSDKKHKNETKTYISLISLEAKLKLRLSLLLPKTR